MLWLAVFGQVFSRIRGMPTGPLSYLDFMSPGILAQSVLFSAIFYGISVIWERDLSIVHKLLVTPAHRSALVAGKAIAAGFRGLVQAAVVYVIAVVELMPGWLKVIAHFNPLTYLVDVLRGAMINGGESVYARPLSFGIMLAVFAVLLALASRLYPGLAR